MKIGVLGNADSWYVRQLCDAGAGQGHDMWPLLFPQLMARTEKSGPGFLGADLVLSELDAVIVRTMPPGSLERVVTRMNLLAGLQASGVFVLNSPRAIECAVDKWLTTQRLQQAGLPVPPTAVCENADVAMEHWEQLGGDVLVKPLFGSEGRGIIRVDGPDLAWRVFRSLERVGAVLYLQKFLAGVGQDFRILLLDGEVLGAMKRQAPADDFRTNAAQAGTCSAWTPTDQEVELARSAAQATDCVFCGVDLIYDPQGQVQVLEVNAVPGWKALQKTCDICVPSRLFQWLAQRLS